MNRKATAILIIILYILTGCAAPQKEQTEEEEMVKRVEEVLQEKYIKQTQTTVYDFVFRDEEGNTMTYYICQTTFHTVDPEEVAGVHLDAISAVFDVKNTTLVKELEAGGHPAAIYHGEQCHYICCTVSPEVSVVLEYDSGIVTEQEAILIIRSIFEGPNVAKELE